MKMTIDSPVQPTTLRRAITEATATCFSFFYHHPQRPEHLYDISIMFDETVMPFRCRLDIRDADDEGNEVLLPSGSLTMLQFKVAVDTLPLIAHITSADRGKRLRGRRVYSGWCRSLVYRPGKTNDMATHPIR